MCFLNIFIKIGLILIVCGTNLVVEGKYCNVTKPKRESSIDIRTVSRNITFYGSCANGEKCVKTRVLSTNQTFVKIETTQKTVLMCCKGYKKTNKGCIPVCNVNCDNGICTEPNVCTCNKGYKSLTNTRCVPDCPDCDHGLCVAPNFCQCYSNYEKNETGVCIPTCSEKCKNSDCTAPDICTCHDGYVSDPKKANECVPICSNACNYGDCVAPNVCECFKGYKINSTNQCEPSCDFCDNGTCVGPNQCVCAHGFKETKIHKGNSIGIRCDPICDPACLNGICIEPFTCRCNNGYKIKSGSLNVCSPYCDAICENSKCVAPNKCECLNEFYKSEDDNNICISCKNICAESDSCHLPLGCSSCPKGYKYNEKHNFCEKNCGLDCYKEEVNCSKDCINGYCSGEDECVCSPGYHVSYDFDNWNICEPICNIDEDGTCANGTCIAPFQCKCFDGYEISSMYNFTCLSCEDCIRIEDNCSSFCTVKEESRHSEASNMNVKYLYYLCFGAIMATIILLSGFLVIIYRRIHNKQETKFNTPLNLPSIYYTDGPIRRND